MDSFGLSPLTILKIQEVFRSYPGIQEAIVYGSRALGNFRIGSDIDLTLKGDVSFDTLLSVSGKLDNLLLPYKFDLSIFDRIEDSAVTQHITQFGQTLYARQSPHS